MPEAAARPCGLIRPRLTALEGPRVERRASLRAQARLASLDALRSACSTARASSPRLSPHRASPLLVFPAKAGIQRFRSGSGSGSGFCSWLLAPQSRAERRRSVGSAAQRARGHFRHPASSGTRTSMCSAWMRASSAKAQGCASPNPGGPTRTPRSGARCSGVLSLAYFSLDKQREVGRTPLRGTKLATAMPKASDAVRRGGADPQRCDSKIKMDPGFRRDDDLTRNDEFARVDEVARDDARTPIRRGDERPVIHYATAIRKHSPR